MFETILFPVDFSKRPQAAARPVAAHARQFHSQVIFLHLVETPDFLFGMPEYSVVSFSQIRDEQLAERRRRLETWLDAEFEGIPSGESLPRGTPAMKSFVTPMRTGHGPTTPEGRLKYSLAAR